ncbi:MAG: hypothetical protein NTV43_13340 [Methylococcales bacterium]|nr:hypothetical protein [Methylococcales bacterium]
MGSCILTVNAAYSEAIDVNIVVTHYCNSHLERAVAVALVRLMRGEAAKNLGGMTEDLL